MEDDGLTGRGIAALRAGDSARARALLAAAVRADPGDARAWLWLSGAVADPAARRECLERALALDPACEPARAGLAALARVAPSPPRPPSHAAQERGGPVRELPPLPAAQERREPGRRLPLACGRRPRARGVGGEGQSAPTVSLWRAIWRRPRAAFRAALAGRAPAAPWLIAALAGVSAALALAAWAGLGLLIGSPAILTLALAAGLPAGLLALLLSGVLLRTGGWLLGGRASAGQVRAALGWSLAPAAAGLPLWLTQLALLPAASFGAAAGHPHAWAAGVCAAIHSALWLWSAALSVVGLAEAHQIGVARAAASWLLAALVLAGTLGALLAGSALIIGLVKLLASVA